MHTNQQRRHRSPWGTALLSLGLLVPATLGPVASAAAQQDPATIERLRRDQDEILRKAERLQALMERLRERYQREGKQEQVDYLTEGLAHLERAGILRDVASIREDLETTAFSEAMRKQREVVDDLERLLNILLARKSIENIDAELQQVAAQARTARELEQRQRELMDQLRETRERELSPAEREIADRFAALRDAERREAERNAQQAGTRRPFLESALQRVQDLLQRQDRLEAGLEAEASGRTPEARQRAFDLGDLGERVRELQRELRDQQQQQELGKAGEQLQQAAAGRDAQALQQARDRLDRLLENPPKTPAGPEGKARDPEWAALRDRSRAAADTDTDTGKRELAEIGEAAERTARARDQAAAQANQRQADALERAAGELAERMAQSSPAGAEASPAGEEGKRAADAVREAQAKLDEAGQAMAAGETGRATERVNEALSALDRARQRHEQENPDPARNAGSMAADSRSASQELQNAPSPDDAGQQAAQALQKAGEAQREVEQQVESAREQGSRPDAAAAAARSREALEQAREALQQALSQAAEGNRGELEGAAERQQELAQEAAAAAEQLQQAAQRGDVTPQQRDAAQQKLDQAQQRMQSAGERLQQGQQASAAQEQRAAAEAMQQAMDALQENRPMDAQQKQQMQEQARAQEQLTEDIIQLAKELKQRENKDAERAVQQASEASKRAQRAMDEGDAEEAQRQQEEARQKLEEAVDELEEEQDRYMDLRQEELLFRMKDELTTFLEKQRPITAQTKEYQKEGDRLSRPARRKVNGLGEEEQALAGKLEFLTTALTEEGNLVYEAVLSANLEDLREIARRLAGRNPDVSEFTTLLQEDVERRTEQLLEALAREQQRREQERQQQQQQQQQQQKGENRFNPQREKLVSLIAELEMLKQLGQDTQRATDNLRTLVEVRADETISEAEAAMIQRLAHRHGEITKLFQQIKAGVEQALQQMQGGDGEGR